MLIMKNQRFRLVYVDAFAGSGISRLRRAEDHYILPLFDEEDKEDQQQFITGSPVRALQINRPFDHYLFVEMDPQRVEQLSALKLDFKDQKILVMQGDGNEKVQHIANRFAAPDLRGVAFLDPYGAHLHWNTLDALAKTRKFDVIVNFPLAMAINRLVKNDGEIPANWCEQLDACFGCADWREAAFEDTKGLFGEERRKRADASERLLVLYRSRLKDIFGHVSRASLVRNTRGTPLYYLIWAGTNPRGLKPADHILRMGEMGLGRRT